MNISDSFHVDFESKSVEIEFNQEMLIGNAGLEGYFPVTYDTQTWDKLIENLKENKQNFTLSQKVSVFISSFISSYSQIQPFNISLKVLESISQDTNEYTWISCFTLLKTLSPLFESQSYWTDMRNYFAILLDFISDYVGWSSTPENVDVSSSLRSTVLLMGSWYGNEKVVLQGINYTESFIGNNSFYISPESRKAAFTSFVKYSDKSNSFDLLWEIYNQIEDESTKNDIFFALGTSKDLSSIEKMLDFIGNNNNLSIQSKFSLINDIFIYNQNFRSICFSKCVQLFDSYRSTSGFVLDNFLFLQDMVFNFRNVINDQPLFSDLQNFLEENKKFFGNNFVQKQLDSVTFNLKFLEYNLPFLENFFN